MNDRTLKQLVLGFTLGLSGFGLAAVSLSTFTAGTPILSNEVNANFGSLKAATEALETNKQNRVTQKCADGSSIKEILIDGSVSCQVDNVGTGTGYSFGTGLSLNGTQVSVANLGIGSAQLANGAVDISKLSIDTSNGATGALRFLTLDGGVLKFKNVDASSFTDSGSGLSTNLALLRVNSGYSSTGTLLGLRNASSAAGAALIGVYGPTGAPALTEKAGLYGYSSTSGALGLYGQSDAGEGLRGLGFIVGVRGRSYNGAGVIGETTANDAGVAGFAAGTQGFGVNGETSSASAIGVRARNTGANGTALEIDGGIKVSGNKAAFVHLATAANSYGVTNTNQSCLGVTDPNAMVIATHNYNPGGNLALGVLNKPIGVYYKTSGLTPSQWCVYLEDTTASIIGYAFNVLVINQ